MQSRNAHKEYADEIINSISGSIEKLGRNESKDILKYMQTAFKPTE
jgi:hypothetical protein